MDVKAIKLELVQNILDTQEERILEQIKLIFDSSKQDWWDALSDEERTTINAGIAQLDRGEAISHEEVMKRVKKIFSSGDK